MSLQSKPVDVQLTSPRRGVALILPVKNPASILLYSHYASRHWLYQELFFCYQDAYIL